MRTMEHTLKTRGIIVPVEWDEYGTPLAIAISTDEEHEYYIQENTPYSFELLKLLRKRVEIIGMIESKPCKSSPERIHVKSYQVLDLNELPM